MKTKLTAAILILCFNTAFAQQSELLKAFEDQVEAFNKGDVERLVENVSEDFKWYYITADSLMLEVDGKENFKKSMEAYFSVNMKVKSVIEEYVIQGHKISFKEVVTYPGRDGEMTSSSAMGIYEFKKGKIHRTWYFIQ